MTPTGAIYIIHQSPEMLKVWRELSELQKREFIKECETANEDEIEKILLEIVDGQKRLF